MKTKRAARSGSRRRKIPEVARHVSSPTYQPLTSENAALDLVDHAAASFTGATLIARPPPPWVRDGALSAAAVPCDGRRAVSTQPVQGAAARVLAIALPSGRDLRTFKR